MDVDLERFGDVAADAVAELPARWEFFAEGPLRSLLFNLAVETISTNPSVLQNYKHL